LDKKDDLMAKLGRNTFYLYLSTIISSLLGYIFWIIVSKLTSPANIGIVSTSFSFVAIITSITLLGIPTGITRFLGKARENKKDLNFYFSNGFSLLFLISLPSFFVILLTQNFLPKELIVIISIAVFTSTLSQIFSTLLVSTLKAKYLMMANTIATLSKLLLSISLLGLGVIGLALGYLADYLILFSILFYFGIRTIGLPSFKMDKNFLKELLKASNVSWIPSMLQIIGAQLGVIVVYGFQGPLQAGVYYISYAIASVIQAIPSSLFNVFFPIVSGMEDGRKRATWKAIRFSLALVSPILIIFIFYSKIILGFFGSDYEGAYLILTILLASILPTTITQGINILAYAYGIYKFVLIIGISISLSRVFFYLTLTPLFGILGASEAFLIGSFTGLISSLLVARNLNLKLNWINISLIILIPSSLGLIPYYLGMGGALILLILSFLLYAKLKIISKEDLAEVAKGFLPEKVYRASVEKLSWLIKLLYG